MRKLFSAFALAALIAGCTTEKEFLPAEEASFTITASREDTATRTELQSNGTSVWWSAQDTIAVFRGPGSTPAIFIGENTAPAASASFTGTLAGLPSTGTLYGIFPAKTAGAKVNEDGSVVVPIPAIQVPVQGGFDKDALAAVARSENSTLEFKNVAGCIKFKVSENDVTSISFKGNGSEGIAGLAVVEFQSGVPVVTGFESKATEIVAKASATDEDACFVKGKTYYIATFPGALESGVTITLNVKDSDPIVISSTKAQEIKRSVIGNVGELKDVPPVTVSRVWGKYSTAGASWNESFGGTPDTDRNVAMDDDYIYIAETNKTKNLWALNVADGSLAKALPTTSVKEEGTFWLSCPRIINFDGAPTLVVCNMTEDIDQIPLYLYVYENGIDAEPTAVKFTAYKGGRMGDTFTFWGASATNSADGQGLTKGLLYFDSMGNDGIRIWKTVWNKGALPTVQDVKSRYAFDNGNKYIGAYWTFPDTKDSGIWGGRNDEVRSCYGWVTKGAPNLWNDGANGNQTANSSLEEIESGWYKSVPCYQFFSYGDYRYVAYTRQVNARDGRLIILYGRKSKGWKDIITDHKVLYQAAIQENAENKDEYNECPRYSTNLGMDLSIRVKPDGVYLACVKQNVGLSLFKIAPK